MSLIYFLHRCNCHIQDEALYNRRMLEGTLRLGCSLHGFENFSLNINSVIHSDKISTDSKC